MFIDGKGKNGYHNLIMRHLISYSFVFIVVVLFHWTSSLSLLHRLSFDLIFCRFALDVFFQFNRMHFNYAQFVDRRISRYRFLTMRLSFKLLRICCLNMANE